MRSISIHVNVVYWRSITVQLPNAVSIFAGEACTAVWSEWVHLIF